MVDLDRVVPLLTKGMKAVNGFSLLPPNVEIRIDRVVAGGLVDVDYQVTKHFFTSAGAKKVTTHEH